ncbi:MAG: hypothetical protein M5U34_15955 [Chloroflexi bacterium]|nr:hypothetical protein [Chloroflexota bacterium]
MMPGDAKKTIRWTALIFSLVPLALTLMLWFNYDRVDAGFQYEQLAPWFPAIGSNYHVALDGISLAMFLLTTILTPLAILASFNEDKNPRIFMALFLIMESAMLGLFASLDLLVFLYFGNLAWFPCISSSRFGVAQTVITPRLSLLFIRWRAVWVSCCLSKLLASPWAPSILWNSIMCG